MEEKEEIEDIESLEDAVRQVGGQMTGGAPSDDEASAEEPQAAGGMDEAAANEEKLQKELKEAKDGYLRLYAEFDNYRKRMQKDRAELLKYANEDLLYELLPSLDNVEIALKHVDMEHADPAVKNLAEGVNMTMRELMRALQKFGLEKIDASAGSSFNPEVHHAVSTVEREDMDENMVVDVMRQGYMYKDKVLRAAMVSVSKNEKSGE